MEIFQTIWNALTTPNEGLTNTLIAPLAFIEIYISILLFTNFLSIRSSKSQRLTYLIIISIWTIFSTLLVPKQYAVFINLFVLPISVFIIFKTTILKSILSLIIISIIMALLDTLIAKSCFVIFNYSLEAILNIPIYRICITLFMYFILFLIYKFISHFHFNLDLLDTLDKYTKSMLCFIFILSCIAIATQFYLIGYYNEVLPVFITILSLITLIAYFLISMYTLIKTNKLKITEQNLEEAQLYNKSLKILHDNVRAFKHDFSNIVQAIGRIYWLK